MNYAKALKNKVIDKTSNAMSWNARRKEKNSARQANTDVGIIKDHRAMKASNTLGSDHGRKVHTAYQNIRSKYGK